MLLAASRAGKIIVFIHLGLWHIRCCKEPMAMNGKVLGLVTVLVLGCVQFAEAQQPTKIPRIGYLVVVPLSANADRNEGTSSSDGGEDLSLHSRGR